jgi:pilus assembly protein FimV
MKGSTKLAAAIALALIGGNAFALGLGTIQVKSKLNQPLDAEIQVLAENAADTAGLDVKLATAEDFQRVGLDRGRVAIPIDFTVSTNSRGQSVVKVTSKDPVREPLLDFLVEVNWSKGKLLREYTVLLDPPVMAPTRTAAAPVPVREAPPAPAEKLAAEPAQPKPKPAPKVKPPHPVAEAKPEKPAATPAPPKPKPTPAPHAAAAGEYGPVADGETLTEIARSTRPDDATNLNEMMLALLKNNPNAFYKDNINALKRGAILRIPSRDEIKANGPLAEAAAAVHEQNQAWSNKTPVAKPTVVSKTGAPKQAPQPPAAKPAPAKPGEHLALVPPAAGKGGQGASDHPGTASGTAGGTETKAEVARVKEALASREQEVSELKSRVKDLEKINSDDQRLLTLKTNEIADLQKKLKELEAKAAAAPATAAKPAPTPAAGPAKPAETPAPAPSTTAAKPVEPAKPVEAGKTPSNLTAKDIWGSISASEQPKPTSPAAPSTAPATPPVAATAPASTTATTTPAPNTPTPSATPATTPAPSATPVTTSTTPAASKPDEPKSISTATPLKPTTAPKVAPLAPQSAESPWWQSPMTLYGGGIGLLVIGLIALMRLLRKPKLELGAAAGTEAMHAGAMAGEDEEQHLLDELRQYPGDPHLSLQLLSLYYANRDAHKFEAAAETMYAHIADPTQPEWQQVRTMGEDLVPHNPLFGGHEDIAAAASTGWPHHEPAAAPAHADETFGMHADLAPAHEQGFDRGPFDAHPAAKPAPEESFDFDLTDHGAVAPPAGHPTPPPPVYTPPAPQPVVAQPPPPPPPAPAPPATPAEEFFAGEDAIGTKLDLAKAYLDMGDPEGARSMLDEVMAEGNDAQKGEARKLLAEIK